MPPVSPATYLDNYLTTGTLKYLLLDTYCWDFPSDEITLPGFQAYYQRLKKKEDFVSLQLLSMVALI